jgi:hypothetical protein
MTCRRRGTYVWQSNCNRKEGRNFAVVWAAPPRAQADERGAPPYKGPVYGRAVQQGTKKRRPYAYSGAGHNGGPHVNVSQLIWALPHGVAALSWSRLRWFGTICPHLLSATLFFYTMCVYMVPLQWHNHAGFFSPKKTTYYFVIWEADNFRHHSWHDWLLNGCHVPFEWLPGSLIDYWWDIIFSVFSAVLSSVCWWAASRALCDKISMWLPLSLHNCLM